MPVRSARAPRGAVLVCLAGILWGSAPLAFDLVHDRSGLGAIAISALRLVIAASVLPPVAVLAGRGPAVIAAIRRRSRAILCIGAGVAGYQALWFAAILLVGGSIATVLSLGLAPVIVTGWESLRLRQWPGRTRTAAVGAAVVGLLLVTLSAPGDRAGSSSVVVGLLLALLSGVLYACTTIVGRGAALEVDALPLSAVTTAVGALCLLPLALLVEPIATTDAPSLGAILYLGVVTTAVASLLLYAGLRTAPASTAAVATLLEPVTATVLAVLVLGDPLTVLGSLGIVLILGSVVALSAPGVGTRSRSGR